MFPRFGGDAFLCLVEQKEVLVKKFSIFISLLVLSFSASALAAGSNVIYCGSNHALPANSGCCYDNDFYSVGSIMPQAEGRAICFGTPKSAYWKPMSGSK